MNFSKLRCLVIAGSTLLMVLFNHAALAQSDSDKAAVQQQALEICQEAAQNRYGEDAVKSMGKKAKWKKGLNGAMVKMKIKPKSKKASKYQCVVALDKSVKFYRG